MTVTAISLFIMTLIFEGIIIYLLTNMGASLWLSKGKIPTFLFIVAQVVVFSINVVTIGFAQHILPNVWKM